MPRMSVFKILFHKYINGTCTAHEKQELFDMIARPEYDAILQELIAEVTEGVEEEREVPHEKANEILSLILHIRPVPAKRRILFPMAWRVAAAAVLLLAGGWFFYQQAGRVDEKAAPVVAENIRPAGNGAILTLADGSKVSLDSLQQGVIANQGGTQVKLARGTVAYESSDASTIGYNTLTTPRGKLFHLVLPDGSDVWLNAGSAIRYPTGFTGNERVVELHGEAYFEITANARMPFRVKTANNSEIRVLGTGFNVNAYENEGMIRTTLLHGRVEVRARTAGNKMLSSLLSPGEQASITLTQIQVEKVDTSQVMAWKKGIFNFENAGIESVMKQLERWYDIEVVYEKGVPDIVFGGKMKRDLDLAHVLRILKISKVDFRLEGRKLLVNSK